jgi:hypothetical protein
MRRVSSPSSPTRQRTISRLECCERCLVSYWSWSTADARCRSSNRTFESRVPTMRPWSLRYTARGDRAIASWNTNRRTSPAELRGTVVRCTQPGSSDSPLVTGAPAHSTEPGTRSSFTPLGLLVPSTSASREGVSPYRDIQTGLRRSDSSFWGRRLFLRRSG